MYKGQSYFFDSFKSVNQSNNNYPKIYKVND